MVESLSEITLIKLSVFLTQNLRVFFFIIYFYGCFIYLLRMPTITLLAEHKRVTVLN